ncbi:MAG: hypothetical protein AAF564_25385, partial [Bacteroidota bacterium]
MKRPILIPQILSFLAGLALLLVSVLPAAAQWTPTDPGSDNMEILGHIGLGPRLSVADLDMEQEMDRPYVYVSRMVYGDFGPKGTASITPLCTFKMSKANILSNIFYNNFACGECIHG